ncbi:NAD(P)/FAD-dependent oxidoreductase [Gordonia aichiensis]|uniref:Putative oxidoreductase n=1 Tax=Gordonia aichiensis NBRC 108223 TaxID=1220583 RepID=L7KHB9_9ACTN|nr:NAD(P)/FAD-dependent oxidoreductase [Gordonia aichiensis]GAC47891.1 putative oxidoreductase [Gordonia aichiensis NBRC 108223]
MSFASTPCIDTLVIGGGPAGLAAAIALARSLRSVTVIDSGHQRNASAQGAHNVLGREGIAPLELLRAGRREAESYGAQLISGEVKSVTRVVSGTDVAFDAILADESTVRARRLLLASGVVDELPDVDGLAPLWGRDVLHCPYCHGYEVRGARIGILGTGSSAMHQTLLFRQLSPHVALIDQGMPPLSDDERAQLGALGVDLVAGRVRQLATTTSGRLRAAKFDDGRELELDTLVVAPRFVARTALYESLGGDPTTTSAGVYIPTKMGGQTPLTGVWAAGNCADPMAMVGASAAAGTQAGAMINADLAMTDARRAVHSAAALSSIGPQ